MNILVESLKRLYHDGEISDEKLRMLLEKETITKNEYNYIIIRQEA